MNRVTALLAAAALAGFGASAGRAAAPPVGPLPARATTTTTIAATTGRTFAVTLPRPKITGRVWRVARAYDAKVVREQGERTLATGAVRVTFRAVGPGKTRIVFALTRGETAHAYAARIFRVVVSADG